MEFFHNQFPWLDYARKLPTYGLAQFKQLIPFCPLLQVVDYDPELDLNFQEFKDFLV